MEEELLALQLTGLNDNSLFGGTVALSGTDFNIETGSASYRQLDAHALARALLEPLRQEVIDQDLGLVPEI